MSLLTLLWCLSLFISLGILFYAKRRGGSYGDNAYHPVDVGDFLARELTRVGGELAVVAKHVRPHGEKIMAVSMRAFWRGHSMFVERIFGRIIVEKGKASSFFLKHIAEYKTGKRDGTEKMM